MTIAENSDVSVAAPTEFTDFDHIMWIMRNSDRPFAKLEARCEAAIRCSTFAAQLALMDDFIDVDPTTLPPDIRQKWEQAAKAMVMATALGAQL